MSTQELKNIKLLCILNFLELQEIKRRLAITETNTDLDEYANRIPAYLDSMEAKIRNLIKDYPDLSP